MSIKVEYDHFSWKDHKLYLKQEFIGTLVKHKEHKGMFWLKWADGTLSGDFYNLTHAKENFIAYEMFKRNTANETEDSILNTGISHPEANTAI